METSAAEAVQQDLCEAETESLLNSIDITILETEKRNNSLLNLKDYYISYLLETKVKNEEIATSLSIPAVSLSWRRYSEFEQLQNFLQEQYPYLVIPPLPEKKQSYTWYPSGHTDASDPDFIDRRRAGLENFLHRVATHPTLCKDKVFLDFLTKETKWNSSLKPYSYLSAVESKWKELTVPARTIRLNDHFDDIMDYSKRLEVCIDGVLKTKARTTGKQIIVDNLHSHLGRLLSEWSGIETEMGDSLQKAGHYIDSIPSSTEVILQEEGVITDQFKEYLFFASSLEEIHKHRVALCMHISRLKESTMSQVEERNRIARGKSTMIDRLFGALQTKEVRDDRIRKLNQVILEEDDKVKEAEAVLMEFSHLALQDFERFKIQKDVDIQQTLSLYISQQVQLAKKGLSTWMNIKRCIENIPEKP